MPAVSECTKARITTGMPAIIPPTNGRRSTKGHESPRSGGEGDMEQFEGDEHDNPGDDRGQRIAQHVAGDRAHGLGVDPLHPLPAGRAHDAEDCRSHLRGFQQFEIDRTPIVAKLMTVENAATPAERAWAGLRSLVTVLPSLGAFF